MPKIIEIWVNGNEITTTLPDGKNVVEYANEVIGWVTPIYLANNKVMLVDEEGIPKHLAINTKASAMAGQQIRGKVVVCDRKLL